MSRVKIGAVVAVVMVALTIAAYVIASSGLTASIRGGVEARVARAEALLARNASLEALDLMARAQGFARDPELARALDEPDANPRGLPALKQFVDGLAAKPDFIAVVDLKGRVVLTDSPVPDPEDWTSRYKAVAAALEKGQVAKDVWQLGKGAAKVGVAPVLDLAGTIKGAVVVGEGLSAKHARAQADLLGAEVIYFYGDRVSATSFGKAGEIEDLGKLPALAALARDALAGKRQVVHVTVNGVEYVASAGVMPLNFDDKVSGEIVLESLAAALAPVGTVRLAILIFGLLATLLALAAMFVAARAVTMQAEEIGFGVGDLINGNLEYTFRPVGRDLDGLANSLNVLLARMLGRPDPSDEDGGEAPPPAKVAVEEGAATRDADAAQLAAEPEAAYYQRIFDEYIAARTRTGEGTDGATLEGFTAKLRLHEANLKKKHSCRAVRFQVVVKGTQVTLKPVPIV